MPVSIKSLLSVRMTQCRRMVIFCITLLLCFFFWTASFANGHIKPVEELSSKESTFVCHEQKLDKRKYFMVNTEDTITGNNKALQPIIYFVTPTYPRREQIPELTRLGQTLMHVPNIYWILADDTDYCNPVIDKLLNRFGIPYSHLTSPMPEKYKTISYKPRGVSNRRAALNWIRDNNIDTGVLYFGDDDNTFDLDLFSEIRSTKIVSMFPVGLIGTYAVSSPIVDIHKGKIIGFYDGWPAKRKWPVDMAGFAVNLNFLAKKKNVTMPYQAGYEEDKFLRSLDLHIDDIEPKANNCTDILVWHTQTKKVKSPTVKIDPDMISVHKTSLNVLLDKLSSMGIAEFSASSGTKAQVTVNGRSFSVPQWLNGL